MTKQTEIEKIKSLIDRDVNRSPFKCLFFLEGRLQLLTKENKLQEINLDQVKDIMIEFPQLQITAFYLNPKWNSIDKEFPDVSVPEVLQGYKIETIHCDSLQKAESYIKLVQSGEGLLMTMDVQYEGDRCVAPGCYSIITK
jgi:hypothetical protein